MDDGEVIPRGARGNSGFPKPKFDQHSFQDFEYVDSDDTAQQIDDDQMLAAVYQANEMESTTGNGVSSGMVDYPFPNVKSSLISDFESGLYFMRKNYVLLHFGLKTAFCKILIISCC